MDINEMHNILLSILDNENFFSPMDWEIFLGIKILENIDFPLEISKLQKILEESCPFTSGRKVKETYSLLYLPKKINGDFLTIEKWQEMFPKNQRDKQPYFYSYGGYKHHSFFEKQTARAHWILIFDGIVDCVWSNFWNKYVPNIPPNHDIALLVEVIAHHILSYKKNKNFPSKNYWGQTKNTFNMSFKNWGLHPNENMFILCEATKEQEERHNFGHFIIREF